jgi:beta-1,4-mannosyltransferase
MKDTRLRVFFLPWNQKNPYQQNLAGALNRHGVEVTACRGSKLLPVLGLLWRYGRPDVLHLHWISGFIVSRFRAVSVLTSAVLLAELWAFRILGIRIVWTVHNLVEHKKRDVGFELRSARRVAACCDALIVHSELGRQLVAEAYNVTCAENRLAVVPHGHYLGNYPDDVDEATARSHLGLSRESFIYLFFGMVQPYKGIPELIDAFRSLDDRSSTLLLVGSCRDAALAATIAQEAASDRRIVPILRHVEPSEVQFYMRAADAVVLPFSDVLTSGSAVLAMGFGRALVVPRIGCLPDYVDSHGGILYDPAARSLRQALRDIARADCRAMGRHNRSVVLQRLGWEQIAAETAALYNPAVPVASRSTHRPPSSVATS